MGGAVFFAANDGVHGRELWRSDGTRAGTRMVKNLRPERFIRPGSRPQQLTVVRGTLYFTADDGTRGRELWKSDGTRAGTVLVRNIAARGSSDPDELTAVGRRLFFVARDGMHGRELWRSNGTRTGTVMVKAVAPMPGEPPSDLSAVGRRVFFSNNDGRHGTELWRSDGSRAGTVLVKDIYPSPLGRAAESGYPNSLVAMGGRLFFSARDARRGSELWSSDGTRAGTVRVKDISPGGGGGYPNDLTPVRGQLFFTASDGQHGRELWTSDGTSSGTSLVANIYPDDSYPESYVSSLTAVGKKVFFSAQIMRSDETTGEGLWTSDGSSVGTKAVKLLRFAPNEAHYFPRVPWTAMAGRLFFSASDGLHGEELWTSDGTPDGTVMVDDIDPCASDYFAYRYAAPTAAPMGGRLFFAADDGTHGTEPWASDGTPEGTTLVADINAGAAP
jgi:ELWxxDGT repeat protein